MKQQAIKKSPVPNSPTGTNLTNITKVTKHRAQGRRSVNVNTSRTIKHIQAEARRQEDDLGRVAVAYKLYLNICRRMHWMKSVVPRELGEALAATGSKTIHSAVVRLVFDDPTMSEKDVCEYGDVLAWLADIPFNSGRIGTVVESLGGLDELVKNCRSYQPFPLLLDGFNC